MLTRMGAELDIVARIEIEIRAAERRLEELRTTRRLILELREKPVDAELNSFRQGEEPEFTVTPVRDRVLNAGFKTVAQAKTVAEAAEVVIRAAGASLDVADLAQRMVASGYPCADGVDHLKNVLRATLSREVAAGRTFMRTRRGTFGLIEIERLRGWRPEERTVAERVVRRRAVSATR